MRPIPIFLSLLLALAIAGCGEDNQAGERADIGEPEGRLSLVNWAGHVEDGSNDPNADWVTSFEQGTGCRVSSKDAETKEDLVELLSTGNYDGGAAPDPVVAPLADRGVIAPVNVDLLPNYLTLFEDLREESNSPVEGVRYGVPHGRGVLKLEKPKDAKGKKRSKGEKESRKEKEPAPKEVAVARPDSWVIAVESAHPNCMYLWLNQTIDPAVAAKSAEYLLEAPSQERACMETSDEGFCARVHADDPAYWEAAEKGAAD